MYFINLKALFILINSIHFFNAQVTRLSCRRHGVFRISKENKKLKSGVLTSRRVPSFISCNNACIAHESCDSINFKFSIEKEGHFCELIQRNGMEDWQDETGWGYYEPMKVWNLSILIFCFFISWRFFINFKTPNARVRYEMIFEMNCFLMIFEINCTRLNCWTNGLKKGVQVWWNLRSWNGDKYLWIIPYHVVKG